MVKPSIWCNMKFEVNWLRGLYIVLFFCNAIFATMFKTIGEETLSTFGTFNDCDQTENESCRGNQLIFRASFSISLFFLMRALLSRFGWVQPRTRAIPVLIFVELPVLVALLVGSFYMPSSFFDDYVPFTRVASGFFILFQIFSIVSVAYQVRDTLLDRIEFAEKIESQGGVGRESCTGSVCMWKTAFMGLCAGSLVAVVAGITYLYIQYGECTLGIVFTTITVVVTFLLIVVCVSKWLNVGLLPPCAISAYLVLICWQALVSNPNKSCERGESTQTDDEESRNSNSMLANALVGSFAMTWTSWRTSSAATKLLVRRGRAPHRAPMPQTPSDNHHFSGVVVVDMHGSTPQQMDENGVAGVEVEPPVTAREIVHEPWQFYSMMCLAGLYMAMVLTDWDSTDGSSNSVSMWVKIVAQWVTILLFSWTLVAPKLFPDRDFS